MTKLIRVLVLTVFFSFLWGVWWSIYKIEKSKPHYRAGPEIRLLALEGVFTPDFLEYFQKQNKIQLVVSEKESESELLREALTHNDKYDLIQITSFISKSFIVDNIFNKIDLDEVPNFSNISVDFKNLEFDLQNDYLLPLSWGLNGFLVAQELQAKNMESLEDLLKNEHKASVLASPIELYNLAIKLKPIIKTWVQTGQNEELKKDLKSLTSQLSYVSHDSREDFKQGKRKIAQMTNGQASKLLAAADVSGAKFILPKERATLWITLVGISRGAQDIEFTHHVLNQLLNEKINYRFVKQNEQSSVLTSLDTSDLAELQKANYIRQVPLSRVELFIDHEAIEPTWTQAVKRDLLKVTE